MKSETPSHRPSALRARRNPDRDELALRQQIKMLAVLALIALAVTGLVILFLAKFA